MAIWVDSAPFPYFSSFVSTVVVYPSTLFNFFMVLITTNAFLMDVFSGNHLCPDKVVSSMKAGSSLFLPVVSSQPGTGQATSRYMFTMTDTTNVMC